MKTRYKHINFQTRLDVWHCCANRTGDVLGFLEWNSRWKQFEFVPKENTGFTQDCLADIADFIRQLETGRKNANAG